MSTQTPSATPFTPVSRQSLSESVFLQLQGRIVAGSLPAGETLPSERDLCEQLQVNRGAVREAVRRLEQAGLVASRHGAVGRVLDFRRHGGLDLLPSLLVRGDGDVDLDVVRSVMEMRSAMGPDAARLCARRDRPRGHVLLGYVDRMGAAHGELTVLQDIALDFWDEVVDGSGNVAYRLALNSLRRIYDPVREAMASVLSAELTDELRHWRLADAIVRGDEHTAALTSTELMRHGLDAVTIAIEALRGDDYPVRAADLGA